MNLLKRMYSHALYSLYKGRKLLSESDLDGIGAQIKKAEGEHPGEIVVAVEYALHPMALTKKIHSRQRAEQVFSELRVWDTQHNNGVLIYLLMADRAVEIVADRGVAAGRISQNEWDGACAVMLEHFRAGDFERGLIAGVREISKLLRLHPVDGVDIVADVGNEIDNTPVIL